MKIFEGLFAWGWFKPAPKKLDGKSRWILEKEFREYVTTLELVGYSEVLSYVTECSNSIPVYSLFYVFVEQFEGMDRDRLTYQYSMADEKQKLDTLATLILRHKTEIL